MSLEREVERQIGLRRDEREKTNRGVAGLKAKQKRELEETRARAVRETTALREALDRMRAQAEASRGGARAAVEEARSRLDEERARRKSLEERLETAAAERTAAAGEAERRHRELQIVRGELEHALRERVQPQTEARVEAEPDHPPAGARSPAASEKLAPAVRRLGLPRRRFGGSGRR